MEDETKSESDSESKSVGDCLDMGKEPQGLTCTCEITQKEVTMQVRVKGKNMVAGSQVQL